MADEQKEHPKNQRLKKNSHAHLIKNKLQINQPKRTII